MPSITMPSTGQGNGTLLRTFIDCIGTTTTTYTAPGVQEALKIWNKGNVSLTLNVGSYTSQTILPGATWSNDVHYNSFTLAAAAGTCEAQITTVEYDNTPVTRVSFKRLRVGDGSTTDVTNPESLLVDFGANTSINAIVGRGSINNYLQLNIQNKSGGASSSSDVVATNNTGTETAGFIDMGINGSAYTTGGGPGTAGDTYLYGTGNNMYVSNTTAGKSLNLQTNGGPVNINGFVAVREVAVPATATSTGSLGDIAIGGGYAYFCTAANTWMRVAIATF